MKAYFKTADIGKQFVLTEEGYTKSLMTGNKNLIKERSIGKPVQNYEERVPVSWLENGWVEERERTSQ